MLYITNANGHYFEIQFNIVKERLEGCTIHKTKLEMMELAAENARCDVADTEETEIVFKKEGGKIIEICPRGLKYNLTIQDALEFEHYISNYEI